MNPKITNFAQLEQFIKEHPEEKEDIEEAYFYLREKDEDEQMQTEGQIDPFKVPVEFAAQTALALVFRNRPKTFEDDKDYQKLVEKHKKLWLEENPGKDFTSKEGLDYLHGSLDYEGVRTLKKDAEQEFRNDPKFKKRVERYDKEKKKVYKNPDQDPALLNTRREVEEHTINRHAFLKTHKGTGRSYEEMSAFIKKRSWERFAAEYPEKAKVYAPKNTDIKEAIEKQKVKEPIARIEQKTIITPTPLRPILPERRITIPQAGRFFDRSGRIIGGFGRQLWTQRRQGTGIVAQAGKTIGRVAVRSLFSNPMVLLAIGVPIAIGVAVFIIIIMLEVGGGGGLFQKGIAKLEGCLNENGNAIVTNGNDCAANLAAYYSKEENAVINATCVDKCSNLAREVSCDRAGPFNNECDILLYNSCGGDKVFCILYTPDAPALNRLYDCNASTFEGFQGNSALNSCNQTDAPTPTPTP